MSLDSPQPFWENTKLQDMSESQWEMLCDGCAKCCLIKLEDEGTGEVVYTKVVCRLLEMDSCQCTQYQQRHELVPNCVWLKPHHLQEFIWLPVTCAYRLLSEKEPLPDWHPLVSGDPNAVVEAGVSIKGRVLSEEYVHPDGLDEHIINWVE